MINGDKYGEEALWRCKNLRSGVESCINGVLAEILERCYPRDYDLSFLKFDHKENSKMRKKITITPLDPLSSLISVQYYAWVRESEKDNTWVDGTDLGIQQLLRDAYIDEYTIKIEDAPQ